MFFSQFGVLSIESLDCFAQTFGSVVFGWGTGAGLSTVRRWRGGMHSNDLLVIGGDDRLFVGGCTHCKFLGKLQNIQHNLDR